MSEAEQSTKPKPSYAPVYAAMYPEMAEIVRKHGYALAVHGSLQRDFDVIAIPWTERPSEPAAVVAELTERFAVRQIGAPQTKPHRRVAYTLSIGFGHCFADLSFMPSTYVDPDVCEHGVRCGDWCQARNAEYKQGDEAV